jgi:hypothetical protein
LERGCNDLQISESKKCGNWTKNRDKTKNFGKNGKQRVEKVWRSRKHGE